MQKIKSPHLNYHKLDTGKAAVISSIFLPVLIETLLSSLYNAIDMAMVGRYDSVGLSAIGLTSNPLSVFLALFQAINVGTTTLVAWNVGTKKLKDAQDVARISLLLNLVAGILMTVLGMGFSRPIVHFMGGEPEVEAVALDYYNILVLGTTAQALTYSVTASMRGAGQSRVPMIYNSVSNLLNVFGNYILIYGKLGLPAMGVIGAGYSTLFSRIICCILALIYVARSKKSPISLRHDYGKFRFEKNVVLRRVGQILRIGIPSALENLIMQCGSILFVKLVASLGTTMFSAHQVGNSLNGLTSAPSTAFSVTANTVCGQHIGAGEMDEAKNFKKYICRWALGVAAAMAIVVNVFSRQIIVLYTTDEDVIRFAGSILTIVSIQYITGFYNSTVMGSLRGAGDTRFAMIVNTVGLFCIRIPFSFLFAKVLHLGINGVWYSLLLQSWVNTVVISLRYKSGKWEDIYHKVNAEKPKKA